MSSVRTHHLSLFVDIPPSEFINLSKATKLEKVVFFCEPNPQWVVMALQTITRNHKNLRQVSIMASKVLGRLRYGSINPANVKRWVGKTTYRAWLELDRILTQLWESHTTCPKIMYDLSHPVPVVVTRSCMGVLLPELVKRGLVKLIERPISGR